MVYQQRLFVQAKKEIKEERGGYEHFQELGVVGEFYNYFYDRAVKLPI